MAVRIAPLQPKDAIAYFRSKGLQTSFAYQDVWQAEHAKAFTVAKMMQVDLLETTRAAIDKAITDGQTFEQFKKELKPKLQAAGWWGRQDMTDPATGQKALVQLGSDRRLRTIYQTNLRQAFNVGNWQRSWATRASFPYLVYHHNSEIAPRPEHQAWDLVCLPIDDSWWDTHYPQCAWGCKCTTESVSKRMMIDRKLKVTKDIPTFAKAEYVNPRTGEVSQVEKGIDPAFNYNAGKSPMRSLTARPKEMAGSRPGVDLTEKTQGFFDTLGVADPKAGKVLVDRAGWPLPIGEGLFKDVSGKAVMPRPDLVSQLPKVAAALKSYDQAEWTWSSAEKTAADREKIDEVLAGAATRGNAVGSARLGTVTPVVAKVAKDAGVDIADFQHRLDASDVRHIFKHHGSSTRESKHGQVGVTPETIHSLPVVLSAPDVLLLGLKGDEGQERIGFGKNVGAEFIIYVAEVRRGRWQLAAKTLHVFPATVDVLARADSVLYAQNDGGAIKKVVDLRTLIKPPRDELVRRYTKTLDNEVITVDFSGGTWTFDIRALKQD